MTLVKKRRGGKTGQVGEEGRGKEMEMRRTERGGEGAQGGKENERKEAREGKR